MAQTPATAAYKGFETWFNVLEMSGKMVLSAILLLFVCVQLPLYIILTYYFVRTDLLWLIPDLLSSGLRAHISPSAPYLIALGDGHPIPYPVGQVHAVLLSRLRPEFLKMGFFGLLTSSVYLLIPLILARYRRRSATQAEIRHVRGTQVISLDDLSDKMALAEESCDLQLGDVPLPIRSEVQHVQVVGTTGSGKTNLLSQVVYRIRERGPERALVYDFKGDYIQRFYDPAKGDVIFNPIDARAARWNVFNEIRSETDIEAVAYSLIPKAVGGTSDPYWTDAARDVLIGIFHVLWRDNHRTNAALWDLVSATPETLSRSLQSVPGGRAGAAHVSPGAMKQALGVLGVLAQHVGAFRYLAPIDGPWSVREWVRSGQGWIFVVNAPEVKDLLRPILSLVIDLVAREILTLSDDTTRRIFVLIDELWTLQRLPSLVDLLTLSRSKGGSCWLGTQDFGRVNDIYGKNIGETIFNNCSSLVCLRVNAPETANYLERAFGEREITQVEETFSMGVSDMRDGVSLARRDKIEKVILGSEIMKLPDLTGYVRVNPYDPVKTQMEYVDFPRLHPVLELRPDILLPSPEAPPPPPAPGASEAPESPSAARQNRLRF